MASPGNADALQRHYGLQQTLAGSPRVHGNQTHLPRDGVWTAIASSNLDCRSGVLNNEVDAIVLGYQHRPAGRDAAATGLCCVSADDVAGVAAAPG